MSSTIAATLLRNIDQLPRDIATTVFQAFSCFRRRKRRSGFSCPGRLDRLFGLIVFGSRVIARLIRRRGNGIPIGFCRRGLGRRSRCRRGCRGRCSTSGCRGIESRRSRLLLTRKHKSQDVVLILIGPLACIACGPIATARCLSILPKTVRNTVTKATSTKNSASVTPPPVTIASIPVGR